MTTPDRQAEYRQHREFYSRIHSQSDLMDAGVMWFEDDVIDNLGRLLWGEEYQRDWRMFKEAKVLDLGCGWEWAPPTLTKRSAPFFCRVLAGQEADIYGVDGAGAINHDFLLYNHIIADMIPWIMNGKLHELTGLGRVTTIAGIQFDVINCSRVISKVSPDPGLEGYLAIRKIPIAQVRRALVSQAHNLLREGGILAIDFDFFRNQNGSMVEARP